MTSRIPRFLFAGLAAFGWLAPLVRAADASAASPKVEVIAGREKSFGDSPVIIVPTIFLQIPLIGKVTVSQQGSALRAVGGGNVNTVKASARYSVEGLDKAMVQRLLVCER